MAADVERKRMAAIARSLADIERDDVPAASALAHAVATANEFRLDHDLAALKEDIDHPEEGFYRRARALGLCRGRG